MHYYDTWGRDVADGDWLSRSVALPMHRWHHDVATEYFAAHPNARAALEQEAIRRQSDPDTLVWTRWMHLPQFYQDAAYPYAIAIAYRFIGRSVRVVYAWQLAFGVVSILLIWIITCRYYGEVAAAIAGVLAVCCAPLMFYELLLLRDSVIVCTGLLLVVLTDSAIKRPRRWMWLALGIAVGVSCLIKSTFVLFAAGLVTVLLAQRKGRTIGLVAGGCLLALTPLFARNAEVGVPPFALASSGPLTFLSSNDIHYPPNVGFGIQARLLATFLGDTDGSWSEAIKETAQRQNIATYASLLWRKWDRVWHWYEIPNNENFYYMRTQVPVLAWLPVTFWLIAPLALIGVVLGSRRVADTWPLYLWLSVSVVPLIVFYVLGRFRVSVIGATIPFAALTIKESIATVSVRRYSATVGIVASVLLLWSWTGRPLAPDQLKIRMADRILPYSAYYQDKVYEAADHKDWLQAAHWYAEFFEKYEPTTAEIVTSGDPTLAPELADMHRECAQLFLVGGDRPASGEQLAAADRLLQLARRR